MRDTLEAKGVFTFDCFNKDGVFLWRRKIDNVVATIGKNFAFNTFLNGSNYSVTGPYMGLISGSSFTAVSASDTLVTHPGWIECGNANPPIYSGIRGTCQWANAANGSIALAAPISFAFNGFGTVQGAFIVFGPGASSAVDSTGGVLWSAGAFFSGAPISVTSEALLQVSYTVSM